MRADNHTAFYSFSSSRLLPFDCSGLVSGVDYKFKDANTSQNQKIYLLLTIWRIYYVRIYATGGVPDIQFEYTGLPHIILSLSLPLSVPQLKMEDGTKYNVECSILSWNALHNK